MKQIFKTAAVLVLVLIASSVFQACNTFRGAGTDIKKGGEAIEQAGESNT